MRWPERESTLAQPSVVRLQLLQERFGVKSRPSVLRVLLVTWVTICRTHNSVNAIVPGWGRLRALNDKTVTRSSQSTRSESWRTLRTTKRPLRSHRVPGRQHYHQSPSEGHSETRGPDRPTHRQFITDAVLVVAAAEPFRCRCRCRLLCCRRCAVLMIFSLYVLPPSDIHPPLVTQP